MLYEKLEYYEVKMIGYNSPSFEPRYSSSSPSHLSNLDYWLEKVWVVENQIIKMEKEIKEFNKFLSLLNDMEKEIIMKITNGIKVKEIIKDLSLNRSYYYNAIKRIESRLKKQIIS